MTFERSFNYALIGDVIRHPKLWNCLSDDFSPPREEYRPVESDLVWYVTVHDGDELMGLWMLHPHNAMCWEVHTALLPSAWGDRARQAGREFIAWVWANTPCRRLISMVPSCNRIALKYALACGLRPYGRNWASIRIKGRLWDQVCVGITAPAVLLDCAIGGPKDGLGAIERAVLVPEGQNSTQEVLCP